MCNWQNIATAPKDGTLIDVWEYCHDPKWRPEEHGLENGTRYCEVKWENGAWVSWCEDSGGFEPIFNEEHYLISHWMPIPASPKASVSDV